MRTTLTPTKRPHKQAHKAHVYPDHPDYDSPGYFLACLLREQAQYEALGTITGCANFYRKPQEFTDAIFTCMGLRWNDIAKSVRYVIEDGLLPFAHAHTTYFDQVAA